MSKMRSCTGRQAGLTSCRHSLLALRLVLGVQACVAVHLCHHLGAEARLQVRLLAGVALALALDPLLVVGLLQRRGQVGGLDGARARSPPQQTTTLLQAHATLQLQPGAARSKRLSCSS
jgi:hypothetical protein